MRSDEIVGPGAPSDSSDVGGPGFGRYQLRLNQPNARALALDEPIPFVLTDRGHADIANWVPTYNVANSCKHVHRGYDQVDQVLFCDDCGEVDQVVWEGGQIVDRKRA